MSKGENQQLLHKTSTD